MEILIILTLPFGCNKIDLRYESHSDRAITDTEAQVEDIDETFRENSISGNLPQSYTYVHILISYYPSTVIYIERKCKIEIESNKAVKIFEIG